MNGHVVAQFRKVLANVSRNWRLKVFCVIRHAPECSANIARSEMRSSNSRCPLFLLNRLPLSPIRRGEGEDKVRAFGYRELPQVTVGFRWVTGE
jgi:hypothetical protein